MCQKEEYLMAIRLLVSGVSLMVAGVFSIKLADKSYIATNTLKPKALPDQNDQTKSLRWDF